MKVTKICAAIISLAFLTTFCGEEETPTPRLGAWDFYDPPYDGAWSHCAVQGDGTFWGTVQLDGSGGAAIVSFDGTSWSKREFGPSITEALNGIRMFDDGTGWACGSDGALLERRRGDWVLHRPYDDVDFYYLGAAGPGLVWAIGQATVYPRSYEPVILYYEGDGWREATKPSDFESFGPVVVTAAGGYLVGRSNEGDRILRLSGKTWGRPITPDRPVRVYGLAAAGDYAFAVGEERPSSTRRGAVFRVAPDVRDITPGIPSLQGYYYRAAYCTTEGGLWVSAAPYASGGEDYKLLYWDGGTWYEVPATNETGTTTRVFEFGFAPGAGWAVGGATYARYREP